jgi:contact-dependent growth inhibition (CDI) system CdiI-like immunity protein
MSTDHSSKKPGTSPISAADFPALRTFLRGYFHQDMKDEYDSPAEAVQEFCQDASPEERTAVSRDWSRFLDQTKGQSLEQINRSLTGALGSSYSVSADDLQQISALLRDAQRLR